MGAMRTHTRIYAPYRVHLGPTSEQALASQHKYFDIFYQKFKVNCTNSPVSRKRLLKSVFFWRGL